MPNPSILIHCLYTRRNDDLNSTANAIVNFNVVKMEDPQTDINTKSLNILILWLIQYLHYSPYIFKTRLRNRCKRLCNWMQVSLPLR